MLFDLMILFFQAPRRIILALDASTSMLIGGKLEMVRQAAKRFIYAISEGCYFSSIESLREISICLFLCEKYQK